MAYYTFDIDVLKQRIAYLKERLGVELCFALKANPFLLDDIVSLVSRIECCSHGEVILAKDKPCELVVSGVVKTSQMVQVKGIFTVESKAQLALIKEYNEEARLLLRLTSGNQFGLDLSEVKEILAELKGTRYQVIGLQYFSGTQKKGLDRIKKELAYLDDLLIELKEYELEELEYGPGLAISYFEDFDEESYLVGLKEALNLKSKVKITLEIGRSIAASCGTYTTKVMDKKTNNGHTYLILDGGMHQLVYFGQFMATKLPKISVNKDTSSEVVTLCGALCTANDILVKQVSLPSLEIGDEITFHETGAYSMCEGMSLFLSRDLPEIYLKRDGKMILVRERFETYQLNGGK